MAQSEIGHARALEAMINSSALGTHELITDIQAYRSKNRLLEYAVLATWAADMNSDDTSEVDRVAVFSTLKDQLLEKYRSI